MNLTGDWRPDRPFGHGGGEETLTRLHELERRLMDAEAAVGENRLGPFTRDADTSRQAALDNYPRSGSQRRRVLDAVVAAGETGRTREELAVQLGLPDSGTDARVWELKRGGFVRDTDRTRKTRLGEPACVLVATGKAGLERGSPTIVTGNGPYDPTSDWA